MTIASSASHQRNLMASVRRARRFLGVCAMGCGAVVLAACSSSPSSGSSTSSASQPAPSSSPAASAAPTPASLSRLKTIVLQATDVPAGWKGTPHQPDPAASANDAALMQCAGARNTDPDKVAEANSDDFSRSDAFILSSASSYRSQSDLDADIATLHSPKLAPCYVQLAQKTLAAALPAGVSVGSMSITITPGSAGGPANVVATGTGTFKVQANGQQIPGYLSVAFITGPLIEAQVVTNSVGTQVPASVVRSLVAAVATRAAQG